MSIQVAEMVDRQMAIDLPPCKIHQMREDEQVRLEVSTFHSLQERAESHANYPFGLRPSLFVTFCSPHSRNHETLERLEEC